ncbi:LysR family transcriptional regulator [Marinitenerispora sediminis]|uniref:LysR family transcriptional regulator n=1 Tax=Marinitenerispora sediminis TaxID=1931232 RepID=A0A368T070_9ACTN|nr:LysR family transcriptional regulator [Marinitenerispora sediminis]RCV49390.1 LysR family transcriptional regulator [Marinitenerispora sediminis]RCV51981.1 LysR family transcriptional regulator [Marinitenerispora sediminis]RCV52103.1 LysR family transcriptional regulator [Marinitenerispora sediminis]
MDLSLRQLSAFVAVARTGSFTAAAQERHIAQSSLSRTVAEIERLLGAKLFQRDTRNVQLTPEGVELLDVAEDILAAHRAGMTRMTRFVNGERGAVTVATLPSVAAVLLPPVIAAFRAHRPGIGVRIIDTHAGSVVDRMADGEADLAITIPDGLPDWLAGRPLVRDRFHAVLPAGHPLAEHPSVGWRGLAEAGFIALGAESSVRAFTDAALAGAGSRAVGVAEARNVAAVAGLVRAGLGVSAVPALVRTLMSFAELADGVVVEPVVERRLDLVVPARRRLSPAARRFVELLEELRTAGRPLPDGVRWA